MPGLVKLESWTCGLVLGLLVPRTVADAEALCRATWRAPLGLCALASPAQQTRHSACSDIAQTFSVVVGVSQGARCCALGPL